MRKNRIGLNTAIVSIALASVLTACSDGGASTPSPKAAAQGQLPKESGTPTQGGDVSFATGPGTGPTWIFPMQNAAHDNQDTTNQFTNLMWRPLYWGYVGTKPVINYPESMASAPVYSDGNKTVTLNLDNRFTWSDGKPVSAQDVLFSIALAKAAVKESPANYNRYTPGQFPDNVASAEAAGNKITLRLDRAYNPQWFSNNELTLITPMPSTAWNRTATRTGLDWRDPANARKIYDYLASQSGEVSSYSSNPLWQVVDGPFSLQSYEASSTRAVLRANPKYTGPGKPHISTFTLTPYTSRAVALTALQTGKLDVGSIVSQNVRSIPGLRSSGYNVYGASSMSFFPVYYNFKNKTNNFSSIISQLYVRQALAHLQDTQAVIKGVFKGYATQSYGPLPATPKTAYTPDSDPYPYDIGAAGKLLSDNGWKVVPNGSTTCQRPGTGKGQCGAGIPQGAKLAWNFYYNSGRTTNTLQAEAFASSARQVGIKVNLVGKDVLYLIENFNNAASTEHVDDWGMDMLGGQGGFMYPTTSSVFTSDGSGNQGSFNDPEADKVIAASTLGNDPNAVKKELTYLAKNPPALFTPTPNIIWAWKNTLSGPPDSFSSLINGIAQPQYWYYTKK